MVSTPLSACADSATGTHTPLSTLATWFFAHGDAKRLRPGTQHFYRVKLQHLLNAYGDTPVGAMTVHQLRQLVATLQTERKWSVCNTNHFITACRVFFRFLEAEELIESDPTKRLKKLKEEKHVPETLTLATLQALIAVMPNTFHVNRH